MNKNIIIVLAGGFLIAILVAMLVQAGLSGKEEEVPVALQEAPTVEILVAAKELALGTNLKDSDMSWQTWPESSVFSGAIVREDGQSKSDALSGTLKRDVVAGEPLSESMLVGEDAPNFVAATLGEGMRAIAISVDSASMVGGFVGPGDYVDIIMTYSDRVDVPDEAGADVETMIDLMIDRQASETIMQNVRVVAVDQTSRRPSDAQAKVGRTITLEVDRQGAEILALAQTMGELTLTLRKMGDNNLYGRDYDVITDARITNVRNEVVNEIQRMENTTSSGQAGNIVRIYNGFTTTASPVAR